MSSEERHPVKITRITHIKPSEESLVTPKVASQSKLRDPSLIWNKFEKKPFIIAVFLIIAAVVAFSIYSSTPTTKETNSMKTLLGSAFVLLPLVALYFLGTSFVHGDVIRNGEDLAVYKEKQREEMRNKALQENREFISGIVALLKLVMFLSLLAIVILFFVGAVKVAMGLTLTQVLLIMILIKLHEKDKN